MKLEASEQLSNDERTELLSRKEKAENVIKQSLKDPASALFHQYAFWETGVHHSKAGRPFSVVCGVVNAKNSYGGYNGYKMYYVRTFLDDGAVDVINIITNDYEMPIPIALHKDTRLVQKAAVECLPKLRNPPNKTSISF